MPKLPDATTVQPAERDETSVPAAPPAGARTRPVPPSSPSLPHVAWLIGPALVAGVAYLDPGNVASNMTAGAQYGYLLVWVVVLGNVMAWLIQYLSAKLGIVTLLHRRIEGVHVDVDDLALRRATGVLL